MRIPTSGKSFSRVKSLCNIPVREEKLRQLVLSSYNSGVIIQDLLILTSFSEIHLSVGYSVDVYI